MPLVLLVLVALVLAAPATAEQPAKPDLVVTSLTAPTGSVTIGGTVSLGATVRNRGDAKAVASKLGFFLSRDGKRSGDDPALDGPVSIRALKPGKKSTQGTPATIPPGTVAGEYSLLACADAKAKVKERKEGNNCRAVSLLIAPPPPGALPYGNDALPAQPARAPHGGDLHITEYFANPDDPGGDANGDGDTSATNDEFVEMVNVSADPLELQGIIVRDSSHQIRHTFPAARLDPGCAAVVFGGGNPSGIPAEIVETASTGNLQLDDGGDTVTVEDEPAGITGGIFEASDPNESWSLPGTDAEVAYVKHSELPGSVGGFSPGLRPDGSAFC